MYSSTAYKFIKLPELKRLGLADDFALSVLYGTSHDEVLLVDSSGASQEMHIVGEPMSSLGAAMAEMMPQLYQGENRKRIWCRWRARGENALPSDVDLHKYLAFPVSQQELAIFDFAFQRFVLVRKPAANG